MSFSDFKDVLKNIAKHNKAFSRILVESALMQSWDEIVGRGVAIHTEPSHIQDGVLWVRVDHPVWQAELHARRAQIYEKMITYAKSKSWFSGSEDDIRKLLKEIRFKVTSARSS
ncbi:MAG: DUF721 domain-containing protein [Xanthomonadaceae bacterium]|nr:DUF721 domain-containing protein [Xanthomonadaceae bacterium]